MGDDNRPTLTLTYPAAGKNAELSRILVGMHDYYSGLDLKTFKVVADFPVDGAPAGTDLAGEVKGKSQGGWELALGRPIRSLAKGTLTVSVKDEQGNISKVVRTFGVGR